MAKSNILALIMVLVLLQGPAAMAARCISTNGEGDCLKLYADGGEPADGEEGSLQNVYSITGSVTNHPFSLTLVLEHTGDETEAFKCTGRADGLFTPGMEPLINPRISAGNIHAFVADATTFSFVANSLFLDFTIFDSGGKTLGKGTSRGLPIVNGIGNGLMVCEFVSQLQP